MKTHLQLIIGVAILAILFFNTSCEDTKKGSHSNFSSESAYNSYTQNVDPEEARLQAKVDNISESDFKPYLIDYAKDLCNTWYGGGGPTGWVVSSCYVVNDDFYGPYSVSDKTAKRCSCTVHVEMEGAMGLGLRSGSVDIWVEGTLGYSSADSDMYFTKGNYRKENVEGGLTRRE
jgi:hypothetical protein